MSPDAKILPFRRRTRPEKCWNCGKRDALADVLACGLCEVCIRG